MSPAQFAEWGEYCGLEPFGFEFEDARFGQLSSTIVATVGAKIPATAFMARPPKEEQKKPASQGDLVEALKKLFPPPPEVLRHLDRSSQPGADPGAR